MSNKSPGMHRTSRLSVTRSASMSAKKGEKRQSIQDMAHSSLSLQKTGASSDQPLRKQKLLASHSSSTEQRCTPHTGEGRPARPWTQSAAVLPSPDRTHHSKAHFKESQASLARPTSSCSFDGATLCSITSLPCCAMRLPTSLLQLALMWTDYSAPFKVC